VRTGSDVRAKFFEQLGFTIPAEIAGITPNDYGELYVPDELITEISKDLLVWNVGFAPDARRTVEALALYEQLPVVQNDRVLWVEDEVVSGAFSWGTVLSLQYALDELLPQITETVN
jgi:iron complex transport system substrate-binding protein